MVPLAFNARLLDVSGCTYDLMFQVLREMRLHLTWLFVSCCAWLLGSFQQPLTFVNPISFTAIQGTTGRLRSPRKVIIVFSALAEETGEEHPTREGERQDGATACLQLASRSGDIRLRQWRLDLDVRESSSSDEQSGAQIFRYGTREHAAVSSGTGDVCEVAVVPLDSAGSTHLVDDLDLA